MDRDFDVIVIGGGHAGIEAARAAARLGRRTALVTLRDETIGRMSCNPAIGGVGKGQIVREIDALGGLMGLAADATGIHFRMLNRSKGPAVWGPRCQSDRHAYARWMQHALRDQENLTILPGEATEILVRDGRVVGVRIADVGADEPFDEGAGIEREASRAAGQRGEVRELSCRAAVVTAGTFLSGRMHLGERTWPGGRYGEPPAARLSDSLRSLGIELGRLKTGTCPRIAAGTIDYGRCRRQDGDDEPAPFSFLNDRPDVEQIPCWLTQTTPRVHEIVRANLGRAPMYSGQIRSTGPRYCPSFETKIVRFPDKDSHLVFLEPEGRDTDWVYANGIPTSLPPQVQAEMVAGIPGLERAEVIRWGYAIEYDYAPPTQLDATLECKLVGGLFLAGQVNGTTGYEEAAGQGLLAGVNAARGVGGEPALVLRRDQAYIGVMIDDLVTKGVAEPYRMFTSRAEHRLTLRADNADRRLTPVGREIALVGDRRWERFERDRAAGERARDILTGARADGRTLWELLRRPDVSLGDVLTAGPEALRRLAGEHPRPVRSVAIDATYEGYVAKERTAMRRMQELDGRAIPGGIDYDAISHLRPEAKQRLGEIRPRSLGQALRISGITPADVTILSIHLARRGGG